MQNECYLLMLSDGDCWTVLGVYLDKPLAEAHMRHEKEAQDYKGFIYAIRTFQFTRN